MKYMPALGNLFDGAVRIGKNRKILQSVIATSFFLLPVIGESAVIYNTTLSIQPSPPITTQHSILAVLGGLFSDSGFCPLPNSCSTSVTISSGNIGIDFFATHIDPAFQSLVSFSYSANIGYLGAGSYTATAYFYVDNILNAANTVSNSFTVFAVPTPSTLYLVVAGLFALCPLNRKRSRVDQWN